MDFEINLNKSIEEIYIPKFETDDIIFSDCVGLGSGVGVGSGISIDAGAGSGNSSGTMTMMNNNQYNCEFHPNYKLSMVCIECITLVCPCCVSSLPIHSGHQHLEVDSDSIVFQKVYYCMTNCKEKIHNVMEIAINEYENIKDLIQEKESNANNNIQISINTQVDVFLDFIDLAIGDNFNFNYNNNNNNSNNNFNKII